MTARAHALLVYGESATITGRNSNVYLQEHATVDLHHFDALAPTVAPARRPTLATLVASATSFSGRARARGKKKGRDCGKRAEQRCSSDIATCRAMYMGRCEDPPEYCETIAACCDTCSANGLLTCLLELQETTTAARLAVGENGDRDA